MTGRYRIIVQNRRLHYALEIKRNITIIQGDSATGKTTLIDMLRQYMNLQESSGIHVDCAKPCRILEGPDWELILKNLSGYIIFIDEGNSFITSQRFAEMVKGSDNYFVLITRESLYNLPYSVDEIYGLTSSGKYQHVEKTYQEMYQIYSARQTVDLPIEILLTEDSNSGFQFFHGMAEETGRTCLSAQGKSNVFAKLKSMRDSERNICVIADGAAFGAEMMRVHAYIERHSHIILYLPESFEWLILRSGFLPTHAVQDILRAPENYADSTRFFSWERYFTTLLVMETAGTPFQYTKSRLNPVYLQGKLKMQILHALPKSMQDVAFP